MSTSLTTLGVLHFEKVYALYKVAGLILQKSYSRYFLLGAGYVMLSLYIGEIHPFTLFPMYYTIPKYAYSFYFSDPAGKIYPANQYFNCGADALSHMYGTITGMEKIPIGSERETAEQLRKTGEIMMNQVKQHPTAAWPAGIVDLHRVCYFMDGDSILNRDIVIYETTFR